MAWLMRELKTDEVWQFISPKAIQENFVGIKPYLGPAAGLWEYLLGVWHELGRI